MMELPKRKHPRLENWSYNTAATYFLTIRTRDRKPLLSHIVGRGILDAPLVQLTGYGTCVEEALIFLEENRSDLQFHVRVIMPNHVHILVTLRQTEGACGGASRMPRPTEEAIPKLVSALKRFTNRKTGADLWQRSYYDHVIRNERDFLRIWQYIDTNPAKWLEDKYYIEA